MQGRPQGGSRLASQAMSGIAVAYDWPDFYPAVRPGIKLDRPALHPLRWDVRAYPAIPHHILAGAAINS
ncbi:MAG TPA: hypothetical protein VHZ55_33405 [Bryobacteraceae bacterium]|nr:hypothetical protein [Bryobacteraceae bacterium]